MAAIVTGSTLGLNLTSWATLGRHGPPADAAADGRHGELAVVNAATGNLVLQQQDDLLVARGGGTAAVRTYNSQGRFTDDNGDNWSVGVHAQRLRLAGPPGAAGSSIVRTDRDGGEATYAWDASRAQYVATAGDGAHDTIVFDAARSRHVRTDGSTGQQEHYDAAGRLVATADASGHATSYAYGSGGLLASVTTAAGEQTLYDYSGNELTQIRTVVDGGTRTLTRVRYGYDASHRLARVTVDLTPQDNAVADGSAFVTTYGYDGASTRVASVTRSDGTGLAIEYVEVAGVHRVAALTDALGHRTTFAYDPAARTATVTDPLGRSTVVEHDAAGQLAKLAGPPVGGIAPVTTFTYTAAGDLSSVTDPTGRRLEFEYDAMGNLVLERDAAGHTVTRTYDARQQLATETAYAVADPDGSGAAQPAAPMVTRHVRDAGGRLLLRFVVTPEGRVTEHRYDALGDRIATIAYAAALYPVSTLGEAQCPTEAEMAAWAAAQDPTRVERTDFAWDARGRLRRETRFARVDATGAGIADGSESVTQHVHDTAGRLLQSISAAGATSWTYDGLGRVTTLTDSSGRVTTTVHDDAGQRTRVTFAHGLTTTTVHDRASRVVAVSHADAAGAALGETRYHHDAAGRLVMTRDASGTRQWMLYDEAGRQIAAIDDNGSLTEYVHDAAGRLTQTVAYATAVDTARLADAAGLPLTPSLAAIRPLASANDAKAWRAYDEAGRLVKSVNAVGSVTETVHDGAGRVVQTIARANRVATTLGAAPAPADIAPVASATADRITRHFHDPDGRLLATLDGEGYLVEHRYDPAGRLELTLRYATRTSGTLWASGTLAQLRPAAHASDIRQVILYDGLGRAVGLVDGENHLTEKSYDRRGNLTRVVRYATRLAGVVSPGASLDAIRPAASAQDRTTTWHYDALDRVDEHTDAEGTLTRSVYDAAGRLVATTVAAGSPDARTRVARHDALGRLVAELGGEGAARLAAAATPAQAEAVWAQYGVRHTVDAAGRRTSTTDANGHRTLHYYAGDGLLRYTVDALGEVQEHQYDALNRRVATVRYGARIATAGLAGGAVTAALTNAVNAVRNPARDSRTATSYLRDGTVSVVTDALGFTTATGYNAFGEATSTVVALGGGATTRETRGYDRRGLERTQAADTAGINATVTQTLDAFGRVTSWTDASGGVHAQTFDRLGRIVQARDAGGHVRSSTYDAFDRVLTQTDALGAVTRYAYDDATGETTVTTAEGIVTATRRNAHGQVVSVRDGTGTVTEYAYDLDGRLTQRTDASGRLDMTTRHAYDRAGRLAETTDARGVRTVYDYDAADRVLARTVDPDGLGLRTTYEYDAKGQQVRETDPGGRVTTVAYDLQGQVLRRTVDPDGLKLETAYSYDGRGRVLTITEPGGTVTRLTYDGLGRRIREQVDPEGLNLSQSTTYDKAGNVLTRIDAAGNATRHAYDANGRLTHTVDAAGGVTRTAYDAEGRVSRITRHAAPIVLSSLPVPASAAQIDALVVADPARDEVEFRRHDRDGRLRFTVDGTGAVVAFRHDAAGRVVERIAHSRRIDLASWNPATDPPVVSDPLDERTRTVHDALGRATHIADALGGVTRLTYDASGNVTARVRFATPVPATASPDGVAASANDRIEVFAYDAAGRETWRADALGGVVRTEYDAAGHAVRRTAFARRVAPGGDPAAVTPDPASDRIDRTVFDAAGRAIVTIDPEGGVCVYGYDAQGNVVGRTEYARPIDLSTAGARVTATDVASRLVLRPADDRTTRTVRDAAGRAVLEIDAEGYVTQTERDALGRAVRVHRFEMPVAIATATPAPADVLAALSTSGFTTTAHAYDAAGRLAETTDASGVLARRDYDALGRLTRLTEAVGRPEQRVTAWSHDAAGRVLSRTDAAGTNVAATTRYRYDTFGHRVAEVDARGLALAEQDTPWARAERVRLGHAADAAALTAAQRQALIDAYTTRHEHDANGRLTRTIAPSGGVTTTAYDAFGDAVKVVDPRGNAGSFYFDKLGRVTLHVDPEGYATETTYDARFADKVAGVRRYFQRVATLPADGARPSLVADGARDAVTTHRYDRLGRVTRSTDATGSTESIDHQVAGNRFAKQVTNKRGGVATYAYDRLGRQVAETLPVQAGDALGTPRPVVNLYRYDAWGNRVQTIEAHGLAEQRTTTFRHDALGRLTHRIGTPFTAFDAATRSTSVVTPVELTRYDALGHVLEVTTGAAWDGAAATGGARTLSYFDAAGHRVARIAPDGALTRFALDPGGRVWRETAHAHRVALPVLPGGPVPDALPDPVDDRVTTSVHDAAGRLIETRRDGVVHWEQPSGTDVVTLALPGQQPGTVTLARRAYDANGNVVQETDGRGHSVFSYYDRLGRPVLRIDPEGYAVAWDYGDLHDAATQETRYAQRVAAYARQDDATAAAALRDPARLRAGLALADARIVRTVVDRLGRTLERRTVGVAFEHVDAASGAITRGVADAVTTFEYDGLGNVTRQRERVATLADGSERWLVTDLMRDALGREVSRHDPGHVDVVGALVRPRTDTEYDGLGQVRRSVQRGTDDASEADDRITTFAYDANGRRVQVVDAEGHVTRLDVDTQGNVARTTAVAVRDADGGLRDVVTLLQYDAAGRNTAQIDAATGEVRRTRYNAFGEIAGKGLGDGWQEFIEYNTLGKVQRSNTGDGVTRIFLYDRAGNATRRIESATVDLAGVSVIAAAQDGSLLHTFSSHDKRGGLVRTVEPDISYLRDQVSMSQAFTQQLADLYGPLSVGHSAGGTYAGGTVDAASFSYTKVSGTDNVESMPSPATPATGVARRYEAPPPLRMAAAPSGAASFPLAWGGSTSFLSKARTRTIQLLIPADFPALAYRVTDATGTVALSGPLAPGQSYLVAGQGTFLLQVQLGAGYYYTISTLQTQTSAEPMLNATYQVEQTWSSTEPPGIWIPPADGAGPFGATVGEATASPVALPVEDPGGGWVFVNAAGLPAGTHQLTLRASDAAGNAVGEVLTVTLGDGARITGRTALADPDVRVAGADGRVLWFQREGIGGTEGVLHIRTAGSTADWRAFTFGGSNADSTPFGLQPGVEYEFIVATSTKETYGQLTIGDDGVPVIANGGMLQAVSRWPQTLDFDLAGRLSDPSAPAYVMELRIGSILVTKALAEARVSFDVATDLAALGVTDHANRRFDYDYRVYGLRGTLRQFVGQGSGTVQLGSDFAAWPTVGTFARKPLALITLPAGASLAGALSVQPQGTPTAIAIASGDWRRTSPTSTSLAIDLSQWLVYGALPRLIDIRYSAGDAVFGATYRLLGNGAVECVAFSAAARQPRIPITVAGATRLAVLKVGATDATLAAVATSRWTTSGSTFTWDAADQAGLGARRFYYEATDAAGQLVGKGYGSFTLAADGTLTYAMDAPLLRPSSVRFTPPAGTASFELRVRPRGSTGAWTVHASLPVDGTARVFDATSLRPATGTAEYECSYVAKDAAGVTVGSGSGLLAIASNGATSATLAEDRKPTVVTLHGPKGKGVPRLQLETRPDGSTGPTITVVLAGTWNAELDCMVFTWQTDVPSAVQYDYTLRMQNADGTAYRNEVGDPIEVRGVMTLSPGASSPVVMQQYVTRLAQSAQVKRLQDYNAFGEVAAEYDDRVRQRAEQMVSRYGGTANAAAVKTTFTYNALGQLLARTDPETHVTHANGARARVRPETRYGYDLTGRLATVTDANGHQGRQAYAGVGDALAAQWAADGGRKAWAYDALGALRQTTDELGAVTRQDTDKLGNVVRVERLGIARVENFTDARAVPSTLVDTYAHDAFGRRIRHTNALGFVDKTFYDSLGRVTRTVSAENRATRYDYAFVEAGAADGILGAGGRNVGGHRVTSTGSDGRATVDKTDYFGRTTWHQDLGGHTYTYRYDIGGRLAAQTSSAGQNIAYAHYANGYIKEAKDLAEHTLSRYGYDNAGNRTWEAYSALDTGGTMPVASYQESTLAYDELNRLSHVKDLAVDLQYEYDAVGNRRAVHAVYWDPLTLGTRRRDDLWYAYDSANRFTLTKGAFSGTRGAGRIVKGTDGVEIAYDLAGQRLSATDAAGHVESYRYSTEGYLEDVRIDGALRARRRVDAAGRTLQYKEWAADGTQRLDKSTTYDRDNRVLKEVTGDGTTEYFYFTSAADDAVTAAATGSGALARVRLTPSTGDTTVTTTYGYQYWDSARQATIRKQAVNEAVPDWAAGFSQFHYDVNGYLKFAHDLAGGRSMRYFTNATGLVLRRDEWKGAQSYSHHWYYAGGRRVGDVSTDPTADFRISYAETLAQQEAADVRPPAGMTGFMAAVAQKAADMVNRRTADERDRFKNFRPVTSADFDQNYEPITPSYPAAAGGTYTVRSGDTLKSIAQALWGDSAMWFLIAQSNDVSGSETLAAGQVLVIPNKVTNIHNDAQTFRPYSPGEAIGHVDPTLPTPPPPSSGDCGGLGVIIMIVVAVVVTVATAGAAAVMLGAAAPAGAGVMSVGASLLAGGTSLGTAAALGAAAVGGAIGSIASQAVGMGLGVVEDFNWKAVAMSALGTAVGAGVARMTSTLAQGSGWAAQALKTQPSMRAAFAGAAGSAITQRLQGEWNWREVAAAAVGGAAGSAAGSVVDETLQGAALHPLRSFTARFATDIADAWATNAMHAAGARGAASGTGAFFADALGSAIGSALAQPLSAPSYTADQMAGDYAREDTRLAAAADRAGSIGLERPRIDTTDYSIASAAGRAPLGERGINGARHAVVDLDTNDLVGRPREVAVVGDEGSRGAWGIAQSLAGEGASKAEVNRIKNQLLHLNPELVDALRIGQRYYVPDTDTPENITLARKADTSFHAFATNSSASSGPNLYPSVANARALGIDSSDAALLPSPPSRGATGSPGASMSAWDGRAATLPHTRALHPFYGTFQYGAAIGVQDAVGAIALPELAAAKAASIIGSIVVRAERGLELASRAVSSGETIAARNYTFNAFDNPGPLAALPGRPASNFFGGRYNSTMLSEDLVFYRGGESGSGKALGQWFTREPPQSVAQVRIDTAVKPQWIDPKTGQLLGESRIDAGYAVRIPKGTIIYEGPVASQGGVHLGGMSTNQIFIPKPWNISGVEVIGSFLLK